MRTQSDQINKNSEQSPSPEWNNESNLQEAHKLKKQGNNHFVNKQYKNALKMYHRSILHLNGIIDSGSSMSMYSKSAPKQLSTQANGLKYSIWLNMAQIYIYQQKFDKALQTLKKAQKLSEQQLFDKKAIKSDKLLYRMAICLAKLNYLEQARQRIKSIQLMDPSIKQYIAQLEKQIDIRQKKQTQKSKKMYQGFFK